MESRLEKLEDKLGDIRADQSSIKKHIELMGKTLGTLADVRSETLHIMKQQAQDRKEHEEIFIRLRKVEAGRVACDERHKTSEASTGELKSDQRWVVGLIFASICGYVFKKLFM